jgi:hypothetical protein
MEVDKRIVRQATLGPKAPAEWLCSLWQTDNAVGEDDDERKAVDAGRWFKCVEELFKLFIFVPCPNPTLFLPPHVSLARISPPSPLSHKIFPPSPLWLIILPPLPHLFASLNTRHFCNRGTAATAPFYPRLYSHPLRVHYPSLRSAVSVCSCLEGCPTNTASLSAPFSSSTAPCSSSHSSKACFRHLLRASRRCSAEALIFAHTHSPLS